MITRLLTISAVMAACGLLLAIGAPPACASSDATAREMTIGGRQVGEVLVNDQVVFRIRTSAGGLQPYQRAQIVAQRIDAMMGDSIQPGNITFGRTSGQDVVMANGKPIITADPAEARLNGTTTIALASTWANALGNAVVGRSVAETPVGQKVVPIISVGSGLRVGGALVAGADNRLDEVVAVAQLEASFSKSVRIRALVPVSTTNFVQNIRRVPGTAVIGLVDIKL